ncbi:hypothetical protein CASFOL_025382 [Castilleja foliolosa]|uniref:Uncharacterized protein n=1 Tax=Castilleja foliolosa TaxID=1961234 RepID=A0ABD3CQZ7_9LAMI
MAILSDYEEEDNKKPTPSAAERRVFHAAQRRVFNAALISSDPLGFLKKVFQIVAGESDLFKSDFLVNDVNAVVMMVRLTAGQSGNGGCDGGRRWCSRRDLERRWRDGSANAGSSMAAFKSAGVAQRKIANFRNVSVSLPAKLPGMLNVHSHPVRSFSSLGIKAQVATIKSDCMCIVPERRRWLGVGRWPIGFTVVVEASGNCEVGFA